MPFEGQNDLSANMLNLLPGVTGIVIEETAARQWLKMQTVGSLQEFSE